MQLADIREQLLQDPDVRKEYSKIDLAFETSRMLISARLTKGFTQGRLAKKLKTHQSSIARLESGKFLPSLSFLEKIASVYKTELMPPYFTFMKDYKPDVLLREETITTQASDFQVAIPTEEKVAFPYAVHSSNVVPTIFSSKLQPSWQ
jgi:transcriptional regulator with XRE-family HTH domain